MFSRSAGHTPTGSLMYEGAGYHAAGPGAGLPYHVSMTAAGDKSSLLLSPALASQPRHHMKTVITCLLLLRLSQHSLNTIFL